MYLTSSGIQTAEPNFTQKILHFQEICVASVCVCVHCVCIVCECLWSHACACVGWSDYLRRCFRLQLSGARGRWGLLAEWRAHCVLNMHAKQSVCVYMFFRNSRKGKTEGDTTQSCCSGLLHMISSCNTHTWHVSSQHKTHTHSILEIHKYRHRNTFVLTGLRPSVIWSFWDNMQASTNWWFKVKVINMISTVYRSHFKPNQSSLDQHRQQTCH